MGMGLGQTNDSDDVQVKGSTDNTLIGNVADSHKSIDFVNVSGVYGTLTVGTSAVLLKVGGSALTNRRYVTIQPKADKVYWGYDSSVTTSTGTQAFKDQTIILPIGPTITVYLIADGSGRDVRIGELS